MSATESHDLPEFSPLEPDPTMLSTARAVSDSASLEELTRPFLEVLHGLTGLESTYLTEVRTEDNEQEILFSDNRGQINIPEGLTVDWHDTLCRRALESGQMCTSNVEVDLPGSQTAQELGLETYVSVPVRNSEDELMGTLCGASGRSVDVSPEVTNVMEMLARLIANQWERDRVHAQALHRAETAEERLRQRAAFLAEAEHKLKSPLTVIRGWSDMLAEGGMSFSDDDKQRAFQTLQRASRDASRQLDELLEEARSEVLTNQLTIEPIEVGPVVHDVAAQLSGVGARSGHTVVYNPGPKARIKADREALWQVLWHLGENAVKYSPDGGTITFDYSVDASQVAVRVSDEGLGVPDDIDVFEPFTRGTSEEMKGIPGTGLGLHIVRNLLHAMQGTVRVARRDPKGSVFDVTLPLTDA